MNVFDLLIIVSFFSIIFSIALIVVTCVFSSKARKIEKLEDMERIAKKKEEELILQNKISD